MSELQDALGHVLTIKEEVVLADSTRAAMSTVWEAASRWANIHPSRLHEWHILHIKASSWGLTHPLDCDLADCAYQTQAEKWDEQPDQTGNYQWEHEPMLESWMRIDPPEDTEPLTLDIEEETTPPETRTLYKIGALDANGRGTGISQQAVPWCTTHDSVAINAGASNPNPPGSVCLWALALGKKADREACTISTDGPDHKWWRDV